MSENEDKEGSDRFVLPPKTSISLELLRESASTAAKKRPNFKSASLARRGHNARPLRRRARRRSSSGSLASGSSSDSTALMSLLPSRPCLRTNASRSLDDLFSAVKPVVPYGHSSKSVKFYLPDAPSSDSTAAAPYPSYRVPFVPDYSNPATAAAAAAFATAFYYPTMAAPYSSAPYYYLASTAVYTNAAAVSSTGRKSPPRSEGASLKTSSMTEVSRPPDYRSAELAKKPRTPNRLCVLFIP